MFEVLIREQGILGLMISRVYALLIDVQTAKNVGSSWRGREAYVGSVVRKLQDLLLVDE